MLFTEDSGSINKYIIDKGYKQLIYANIIKRYPYLDYDYLMDPYLYFGVMKQSRKESLWQLNIV